jgi:hypothetical protein
LRSVAALKRPHNLQKYFILHALIFIISSNSSDIFQLLDNGGRRVLDSTGTTCVVTPCESRVPLFQLNETAKTVTIEWADKLAPSFFFLGDFAPLLQNGNIEFDNCGFTVPGTGTPANSSTVMEVTKATPPQTVWQMQVTGQYAYRSYLIPSLIMRRNGEKGCLNIKDCTHGDGASDCETAFVF